MTIAEEVAGVLSKPEIEGIRALRNGESVPPAMAKLLKTRGILNPKMKRPLTLYGSRVIKYLKEQGRWT